MHVAVAGKITHTRSTVDSTGPSSAVFRHQMLHRQENAVLLPRQRSCFPEEDSPLQ